MTIPAAPRDPLWPSEPDPETPPGEAAPEDGGGLLRTLLRVPLFYKILVANAALAVIGAALGTLLTQRILHFEPVGETTVEVILAFAVIGAAATLAVNALILRLALSPLQQLEATAARVHAGDLTARVPDSPLADREMQRLTRTFNSMLDNLAAYRQRLRDVAARALDAEEEERKRISRELHDDTAQSLAALMIQLRLARGVKDPEARDRMLEELRAEVGESLERVRRFARGLRPPALDELGLVPALESYVRTLVETTKAEIRLEADPIDHLLSPQEELALYRIVQEALTNAIRHGDPRTVAVTIARADALVAVTVADDGRGFRLDDVLESERPGLGLFGMQERAAYVGGRIDIDSAPGRGTRVRAEIPMGAPQHAASGGARVDRRGAGA